MRNHYQLMVRMTDRSVKGFLANQCMDPSSELYGITPNHGLGYVSAEQGVGGSVVDGALCIGMVATPKSRKSRPGVGRPPRIPATRQGRRRPRRFPSLESPCEPRKGKRQ